MIFSPMYIPSNIRIMLILRKKPSWCEIWNNLVSCVYPATWYWLRWQGNWGFDACNGGLPNENVVMLITLHWGKNSGLDFVTAVASRCCISVGVSFLICLMGTLLCYPSPTWLWRGIGDFLWSHLECKTLDEWRTIVLSFQDSVQWLLQ